MPLVTVSWKGGGHQEGGAEVGLWCVAAALTGAMLKAEARRWGRLHVSPPLCYSAFRPHSFAW